MSGGCAHLLACFSTSRQVISLTSLQNSQIHVSKLNVRPVWQCHWISPLSYSYYMYLPKEWQPGDAQSCAPHLMPYLPKSLGAWPPPPSPRRGLVVPLITNAGGKHPCVNKKPQFTTCSTVQYINNVFKFILVFDLADIPLYETSCLTGSIGSWNRLWNISWAVPHLVSLCLRWPKGGKFPLASLLQGVVLVCTMFHHNHEKINSVAIHTLSKGLLCITVQIPLNKRGIPHTQYFRG